jgi:hypothetical protein
MRRTLFIRLVAALFTTAVNLAAQTSVLTRSYDNGRTGANMSETILTPALIAAKGLKRARA